MKLIQFIESSPWNHCIHVMQIPEVIALIQFNVGIMNSRVPTIELNKFMELNPSIEGTIPDSQNMLNNPIEHLT